MSLPPQKQYQSPANTHSYKPMSSIMPTNFDRANDTESPRKCDRWKFIAFSPDGKYLFSANGPWDVVSVVDLATEKGIARKGIMLGAKAQ